MTIFDQIKALAFTKQRLDVMEAQQPVSPFMLQRWLSMYSPQMAMLINATTNNRLWAAFGGDLQMQVDLLDVVTPKLPFKRISYIKKPAPAEKAQSINDMYVETAAHMLQISKKQAAAYLDEYPELLSKLQPVVDCMKQANLFRKTRETLTCAE